MKKAAVKQLIAALLSVTLSLLPVGYAYANQPYFKVFGGDVMSGGWFKDGDSCPMTEYQFPTTTTPYTGGISTFTNTSGGSNPNSAGGSSSQFAAFAVGFIESTANPLGFYSAGAQAVASSGNTPVNALTFANNTPNTPAQKFGGGFDGSVPESNCVPDYFSYKSPDTTSYAPNAINGGYNWNPPKDKDYYANAGFGVLHLNDLGAVTVPAAAKTVIYVDGNVYIKNDITYANSYDDSHIPKFAIVARGNIYIDPEVRRLDGLYVAQPKNSVTSKASDNDGKLWTCHDATNNPVYNDYPGVGPCHTTKLIVNGSLIAKQIILLRTVGDLGSAGISEDSLGNAQASGNISELINYTPSMVLGGPFFNVSSSTSLPVQSLVNLPPIF